ncbi:polysaccharide biosynthesis protein [Methanosarcina horonobensis HB-1 = JCM 15518]|uniref:Polysaccharide biosynthesis protein n=2 Tax=Methanosarcina horonobensis TaxID=418008 RepID=A0A0E3S9B2_9EURY|nr:flippase [Methanosarcina horonobensis]AKB77251.1 polysaccharide biosynthesis protein [Methanosarcina horonobensis HB-1 = JCM 15518]
MLNIATIFSNILKIDPIQRQSIVSVFWQVSFTAIGFLSTMYFAHTAGASILGSYFLFLAYYGIFGMFTDGGFGGAAVKRISEGEEPDAYFSAYFLLRLVFTITGILVLLMFKDYFVGLNKAGIFDWLLLLLFVSALAGPISSGVAGKGKMGIRNTCEGISNISRVMIQVPAIYLGYETAGLAGGMVAGMIVAAVIEFRFFDLHLVNFQWKHIKSLSVFSFWLFLTSSGVLVFSQADTVLIGHFMDVENVGIYRVVLQFTGIATFSSNALRLTLWPRVSQWGKTKELYLIEESLSRAISYSLLLAIPVLVGGILLGDRLLYSFYGADFAQGYHVLIILLAVQVVNIFQYFFTMYLDALDHPQESFKVTAIGVGANIALNIILIPLIGINGAAIATLATMTLNALLAWRALSRHMTIKLERQSLSNIMMSSVVMGLLVGVYRLFVPLSNIWVTMLVVAFGGIAYGFLILKFDKKVYTEMKDIVEKVGIGFVWPGWL